MKTVIKENLGRILSWVVVIFLVAAEALAVFKIRKLQMLPDQYFFMLSAAMILITAGIVWLLFGKSGKIYILANRILAWILSLVIIAGCLAGFFAVDKLNKTLSSITASDSVNIMIDVYVRSDDTAETIEDCGDHVFALADSTDIESHQEAAAAIGEILGAEINLQHYDSIFAMITGLYAGDVDAIILDQSYAGILEDAEGFGDFSDRARLLYEYIIEKEAPPAEPVIEETEPIIEDITNTPFLLYISGSDSRRQLLANSGSDVNILAAINPQARQVLLVNTPRDYFVANPAGGGALDKLSHCGLAGIENSAEAMTLIYGHEIDYHAKINFTGFKTLIDAIGGVTIYSDFSFTAGKYHDIWQGENHLNGEAALAYARERYRVSGGDNTRGKHQMKLISAMIDQLSASTILNNYSEILDSLDGMFTTSIPAEDIAKLVKMQLSDMASWDVLSFAVTGENGNNQPWALGGLYAYVMYPHEDKVELASDLIGRVLDGEILSEEDLEFE